MMRRLAVRSFHVAIAATLLRAGVAFACPTPPGGSGNGTPQCTLLDLGEELCPFTGDLDLDVGLAQGVGDMNTSTGHWVVTLKATRNYFGSVNVCDGMALFESGDLAVSLKASPTTALRNVRVVDVKRTSTQPSLPTGSTNAALARYGSGAFCLWATEDNSSYDQSYQITVEAFDPQGSVHKGQATVDVVCKSNPSSTTSLTTVYYQFNINADGTKAGLNPDYCTQVNANCLADAAVPTSCSSEHVCQCTDITTPSEPPAVPGNVCIEVGERVYCGPLAQTVPGTPPGQVCIAHGDTVCGPVSVCVTSGDSVVCGPASGPGSNPGEVCVSREGTVCGGVTGSGSGPGNDSGDVCVSREGTVCGSVTTDNGCSTNREGTTCPASSPGDVCVKGTETVCGQVPVGQVDSVSGSTGATTSSATSAATSAKPKAGCAAFPGVDLGAGLLALLGLGALRRRRR